MDSRTISTIAGAAGAAALTIAHEAGRRLFDDAPRLDVLGERAIAAARAGLGVGGASRATLHQNALAGDLIANAMYYAMVGTGPSAQVWGRGLALGLAAGIGAITLPEPLGLEDPRETESPRTRALAVTYYVIGGLAAAAAANALQARQRPSVARAG
jgi:hypothetical protein